MVNPPQFTPFQAGQSPQQPYRPATTFGGGVTQIPHAPPPLPQQASQQAVANRDPRQGLMNRQPRGMQDMLARLGGRLPPEIMQRLAARFGQQPQMAQAGGLTPQNPFTNPVASRIPLGGQQQIAPALPGQAPQMPGPAGQYAPDFGGLFGRRASY